VISNSVEHVSIFEVPHNYGTLQSGCHLLACSNQSATFAHGDLGNATFVTLQISILLAIDGLDDEGPANGPNEVHV